MNDPLNDPRWPNRPQHPDFWRMSEVVLRIDGASTEGGKTADEIIGVDLESFSYLARTRIQRTRQLAGPAPLEVLLMTLYMDAFALGKGFAEASEGQGLSLNTVITVLERQKLSDSKLSTEEEWFNSALDRVETAVTRAYNLGDRLNPDEHGDPKEEESK